MGATFELYSRAIGAESWMYRYEFSRPDLPATLQVGLIAYIYEAYPGNLNAQFDWIRFDNEVLSTSDFNQPVTALYAYPNPFKDIIHLKSQTAIDEVQVFDLSGQKLKTISAKQQSISQLSLKELSAGIYFLRIFAQDQQELIEVIKQ
ncbi:T9SS type A sorting domain-containing protein [Aquimarina brevivitae]|uniref:Putative secreted protein (Por secretion system target) n=1 Tax=Aquimarina brevivitae TaxID=323412 RepID=A0A4Q7PFJ0_9FLAO|nr:T9SS type A sorting domain-containing protein [Aquimarina brevivitae]RZS99231.1 putative secreted protein (Por secretion system target) [Aquimarina brevivitae]